MLHEAPLHSYVAALLLSLSILTDCCPTHDLILASMPANISEHVERFEAHIEKPENDKRIYLGVVLKNKMRLLLVEDSKEISARASLTVNVGSLNDPRDFPGLAHFLEHVIMSRSDIGYYSNIMENGGYANGATEPASTTYYFSILNDLLFDALKNLSLALTVPLINQTNLETEIQSIQSEYNIRSKIEDSQWSDILTALSNANHSFNHFCSGNKELLLGGARRLNISLSAVVQSYFDDFYSVDQMALLLIAPIPLMQLVELAVSLFANFTDKNLGVNEWYDHPVEGPNYLGFEIKYVPLTSDHDYLTIYFALPDLTDFYSALQVSYVQELFRNRDQHSLHYSLTNQMLIYSWTITHNKFARGFSFLQFQFDLTARGLDKIDSILEQFFGYLNHIKSLPLYPWIIKEIGYLRNQKYHSRVISSSTTAVELSQMLLHYDTKNILRIGYESDDTFEEGPYKAVLSLLRPDNFNFAVNSPKFRGTIDQKGKCYGARFGITRINQTLINVLETAQIDPEQIHIPSPNEFLIRSDTEEVEINRTLFDTNYTYPRIVYQDNLTRLWLSPASGGSSKVHANFVFKTPQWNEKVKLAVLAEMIAVESRNELQNARIAGYNIYAHYSLRNAKSGIVINLEGHKAKISTFVKRFFHVLTNNISTKVDFKIAKNHISTRIKEYLNDPAYIAREFADVISYTTSVDWADYLPLVLALTKSEFDSFRSAFLDEVFIESFIFGDIDKELALQMFNDSINVIRHKAHIRPTVDNILPITRSIILPTDSFYLYETFATNHTDSAVNICFMSSVHRLEEEMAIKLAAFILQPMFFKKICTEEQLGYVARCWAETCASVSKLCFLTQGNYSAKFLHSQIESFVSTLNETIASLSPAEVLSLERVFISMMYEQPYDALSMFDEYQYEIQIGEYFFSRGHHARLGSKNVTISDVLQFINDRLDPRSTEQRILAVYVHGAGHKNVLNSSTTVLKSELLQHPIMINDIAHFKQSIPLSNPAETDLSKFISEMI